MKTNRNLTAITMIVWYGYSGSGKYGWWAKCHWQDNKFCESKAMEGQIYTRYAEPTITEAIDAVLEIIEKFKIKIWDDFALFYKDDGMDKKYPPPKNWKQIIQKEAKKRNWETYSRNKQLVYNILDYGIILTEKKRKELETNQ